MSPDAAFSRSALNNENIKRILPIKFSNSAISLGFATDTTQDNSLKSNLTLLDAALCGGWDLERSHEMMAAHREWGDAAVSSCLLALVSQGLIEPAKLVDRPSPTLLWIGSQSPRSPQALATFGLSDDHCFFVASDKDLESLWVAEEALRAVLTDGDVTHAAAQTAAAGNKLIDVIIVELLDISLTQSLRLNTRLKEISARGIRPPLLMVMLRSKGGRHPNPATNSACATRWQIGTPQVRASQFQLGDGDGDSDGELPPSEDLQQQLSPRLSWTLELLKNRTGRPGSWTLEWCYASNSLSLAPDLRDGRAAFGTN